MSLYDLFDRGGNGGAWSVVNCRLNDRKARRRNRRSVAPGVQVLEERRLLAANGLPDSYEIYTIALINTMRKNPAAFGEDLRQLYTKQISRSKLTGMSSSDPIWDDIRESIKYWENKGLSKDATDWYSGFNGRRTGDFLSYIGQMPRGQGLAFNALTPDGVQIDAERHSEWMLAKGLMAHSAKAGETSGVIGRKIEGLSQPSPYPWDHVEHGPNRNGWGENINERHDQSRRPGTNYYPTLRFARAQYDRDHNANAYYTRLAYYDLLSYILDWGNGPRVTPTNQHPFGHLKNLCALDPSQAGQLNLSGSGGAKNKELSVANELGASLLRYQHPWEPQDGLAESWVSTHRTAWRQSSVPGGYISGVVYEDRNRDGFYTPGEGIENARIGVDYPEYSVGGLTIGGASIGLTPRGGFFSRWTDAKADYNGRDPYVVTLTVTVGSKVVGKYRVPINKDNTFLMIPFVPNTGFALLGDDPNPTATLVADINEPNNTASTAADLGSATVTTPINFNSSSLSIDTTSDQDWFKFSLGSTGAAGDSLRIGFSHAAGDLDLQLYRLQSDGSTQLVASSASSNDEEVISLAGKAPGTYVAKVYGYQGAKNFYVFQLQASFGYVPQIAPAQLRFTLPSPQSTLPGRALRFGHDNGNPLVLENLAVGDDPIVMTIDAQGGQVSLGSTQGLTILKGNPALGASLSVRGTLDDLNAALNGLRFTPGIGVRGAGSIRLTATGAQGGATTSALQRVTIMPRVGDFDGDGKTDMAVLGYGRFAGLLSGGGAIVRSFGGPDDQMAVGDFDGDGKADVVAYGYGRYAGVLSSGALLVQPFGGPEDVPVLGDFDGDGKTDLAVHGYGRFAALLSGGGAIVSAFGGPEDVMVAADFDGDGKTDLAAYGYGRFAAWLSGGGTLVAPFGGPADVPVIADFDGDGKTDLAVYGYGRFAALLSGGGAIVQPFGGPLDVPVVGDFDGDGKADLAVYGYGRLATLLSGGGAIVQPFGGPADVWATIPPRPRRLGVKLQAATPLLTVASAPPVASAVQIVPPVSSPSPAPSLARQAAKTDAQSVAVRHENLIAQRRIRPGWWVKRSWGA